MISNYSIIEEVVDQGRVTLGGAQQEWDLWDVGDEGGTGWRVWCTWNKYIFC